MLAAGALVFACAGIAVRAGAAAAAGPDRLDPRLAALALTAPADTVSAWVEFQDKGERDPQDLARLLGDARAALTPRALARRLRAHVDPLVDALDIPVHAPYLDALSARGLRPYGVSRWFNRAAVRSLPGRLPEIAALPFVRRVVPVERAVPMRDVPDAGSFRAIAPPVGAGDLRATSAYGMTQPQLDQMALPPLHARGYTGAGVLVCMLDDGFNFYRRHEALKDIVIPPGYARDFVEGDTLVQDTTASFPYLEHGAWTLALIGGNKPGTYLGSAYGATFALGRTENDYSEHVVEMVYWGMGAEWADSLGAEIISSSLGYNTFDPPDPSYTIADLDGHTSVITRAAEIAAAKGILVVNSAGNEGSTAWQRVIFPADVNGDSLIAVGAVNAYGIYALFSSRGPTADGRIKPDLAAWGTNNPVPTVTAPLNPSGYFTSESGTSFSCPLVAGAAACLLQAKPTATPQQIIAALRVTASQASSPDIYLGYGIPNVYNAYVQLTGIASVPPGAPRLALVGPNPLRAGELARFRLAPGAPSGHGTVSIYDATGRRVRTLWSGDLAAIPAAAACWDGRDDDLHAVRPGLYFACFCTPHGMASARLAVLR
jgi:serine protease AprX